MKVDILTGQPFPDRACVNCGQPLGDQFEQGLVMYGQYVKTLYREPDECSQLFIDAIVLQPETSVIARGLSMQVSA